LRADGNIDLATDDDESDAASDDESRCFTSETGKEGLGRKERGGEERQNEEEKQEGGSD
jgi:hypothetical protein